MNETETWDPPPVIDVRRTQPDKNDPTKEGKLASPVTIFGVHNEKACAAMHTGGKRIEWCVFDLNDLDEAGLYRIISRSPSFTEALAGHASATVHRVQPWDEIQAYVHCPARCGRDIPCKAPNARPQTDTSTCACGAIHRITVPSRTQVKAGADFKFTRLDRVGTVLAA